jgi:hypothetical protein
VADLEFFADSYSNRRAFALFSKPLVIWSGTWRFSSEQIADVTRTLGERFILASERSREASCAS